jgi:hypothetical protein
MPAVRDTADNPLAFPSRSGQWHIERSLGAYSGGAVLDFHQLPNIIACMLLKAPSA